MRTYRTYIILFTCITSIIQKRKPIICIILSAIISTSKNDMEILFKQLKRLTKVAPVYFVYGNHENKTKFTKNNIIILND